MNTRDLVLKKYNIKTDVIEIPNVGRDDLAKLCAELGFKKGVEVGVAAGGYSKILAKFNPQMKLYGVDPYVPYKGYRDYQKKSTFRKMRQDSKDLLSPYKNYEFIYDFSTEAVKQFKDGELDFVYLDANHRYEYVTEDIELWYPKVRPGGIIAGDDYARIRHGGQASDNWAVIQAVRDYFWDAEIYIWGLEAKLPGLKRDAVRSWMVIK